ncbi:hypothetical protein T06_6573 [Trichinella sp. T6]|nr:hypothetical protein T06_6573 [Trichinella sp. T6]
MLCFSWCFVHLVSPLMRFACGRRLAHFSSCSVGSAFYEQMQKSNWDFTTPDASKFASLCVECGSHLPVSPCPPVVPHVLQYDERNSGKKKKKEKKETTLKS